MRRLIVVLAVLAAVALPQRASAASVPNQYPVGPSPYGVVVDPTDGRVYVGNDGGSTVSAVNPATSVVSSVAVGTGPGLLALDPVARRLYVSNRVDQTLSVVNVATTPMTVVTTVFDTGGLAVTVDPAAHRAYVVGTAFGVTPLQFQLVAVDTLSNTVTTTKFANATSEWWGIAHDPVVHRVYVTNMNTTSPTLRVLSDNSSLSFLAEVPLPKAVRFAVAVDRATHAVFLASEDPASLNPSSDFYVIDYATNPLDLAVNHTTSLGGLPGGIALAPANNRIYVTDIAGHRLLELDGTSFAIVATTSLTFAPAQVALHQNGRLYIAERDSDKLAEVVVGNNAPVIDAITFNPSSPRTNDLLHAIASAHDPDGDLVALTYQWSVNGTPISGATGDTLNLSAPGNGDRGQMVSVLVTASDGVATTSRTGSVEVANTPPAIDPITFTPAAPLTNDLLRANVTTQDADGDPVALAYQWSVNGTPISGATSDTLNLSAPGNGDRGQMVSVHVTASDDAATSSADASVVVGDSAPAVTVALSDNTPQTNDVLTATATATDADAGESFVYTFVWKVNGVTKETTTGSSSADGFDLSVSGNGDSGETVTVEVVVSDGTLESAPASASAVVATNATPTVTVTLNDTQPWKGETLVARAYGQDADGDSLTFTFTWKVDGDTVRETTTASTTDSLILDDRATFNNGSVVVVTVTANDGTATSEPASASATITPPGHQR